ncbi:hypothetical protein EYZ11_008905 [Aspergillus tanneri]|uniref:Uncharacterized protein n=1 Tax=Aspergillus tanneri TaxID=1220188 RepID=A0A4S3JER0_9EURO|nr:hypothetical protein EYZ11_008905 [Aspergillus tanneri]
MAFSISLLRSPSTGLPDVFLDDVTDDYLDSETETDSSDDLDDNSNNDSTWMMRRASFA